MLARRDPSIAIYDRHFSLALRRPVKRTFRAADKNVSLDELPVVFDARFVSTKRCGSSAGATEIEYKEIVRIAEKYLCDHDRSVL